MPAMIPYYYLLDAKVLAERGNCTDCGRITVFHVRYTETFLCVACYLKRAFANTLGEVCHA